MERRKTIALLATVLLLAGGRAFAAELTAVIQACSGTVEIRHYRGEWLDAKVGMVLEKNTQISTGFKSSATLLMGNSTILIRPLTRINLEDLVKQGNDEEVTMDLRVGRVRADVAPPSGGKITFTVNSPQATNSVRGTQFEFDSINLIVHNGVVAYTGKDQATVFATAGKLTAVDRQGRSVIPVTGEERQLAPISVGAVEVTPPSHAPVSPVVAGEEGILTVPGIIGAPGGGVSGGAGEAAIGSTWR
jgi:ferric-dicitrate binding protein FerR (iron transport regulator)